MASLKKPVCCPSCEESESLEKRVEDRTSPNYEGWYCSYCVQDPDHAIWPQSFIVFRPKRNKDICRECGAKRGSVEFCNGKNLCKKCQSKIHADYREENAEELKKWREDYWAKQDPVERWQRVRKTIQGSMDAFLRDQMYHIKTRSENPKKQDPKDDIRRQFDLDGPYLMEVFNRQEGKCAITGLPLSTKFGDYCAASIDRVDSSKGHVKGNIQIVCMAVNLAKRHYDNGKLVQWFDLYFYSRLKRLSAETGQPVVTAVQNTVLQNSVVGPGTEVKL